MNNKKPSIWVGAIVWKDFTNHAMLTQKIEKELNLKIELQKYGKGIIDFNYIPIVVRPTNKIHEEEVTYSSEKKELNIHLKLDYNQVINAGLDGFLPLVGQRLLEGIDSAPQQRIKGFDWVRFRQDVVDLLAENGWLLPAKQV